MRRRTILLLGGCAALVAGFQLAPRWRQGRDFTFDPIEGMPEFRSLAGGAVSGGTGAGVLIGLGAESRSQGTALSGAALCHALFGDGTTSTGVPVAIFTDFFCPYCRVLERELKDLVDQKILQGVTVHQVPILGPSSQLAAKASVAARLQSPASAFQDRLAAARFRPSPDYLRRAATETGLDAGRLIADMDGPEVARRLAVSRDLFDRFGFVGTPGSVVGRTAVNGEIAPGRLKALISMESLDPACRT